MTGLSQLFPKNSKSNLCSGTGTLWHVLNSYQVMLNSGQPLLEQTEEVGMNVWEILLSVFQFCESGEDPPYH